MNDLISRSKIYVYIKTEINPYGKPFEGNAYELGLKLMEHIEQMDAEESVTDTNVGNKWIPCSERLPEENRDGWTELVLSIKTGEVILGFWHDIETGFCRRFRDGVCSAGGVIAWMPLPEPYKGEQYETD